MRCSGVKHTSSIPAIALVACAVPRVWTQAPTSQAGSCVVEIRRVEWRDAARDRTLPVKLYLPDRRDAAAVVCSPTVVA